ncbi:hypothetical protein Godav_010587, partial [Gossypium davidsonii]|nr:hypothetical protein [Gossypium davidsonii]MBA0660953.1 hypothetical protein [Gossypium klotzschianum]
EVIRDEKGKWILRYNCFLRKYSIFIVELCGILDSLLLLRKQSYDEVTIQSNNLEIVEAICDNKLECSNSTVVRRVQ